MFFLRQYITSIFALCAVLSLHSQSFIEGSVGLTRNGFFHFDKETQSTQVEGQVGQIFTLGLSRNLRNKTLLKYGFIFDRYRGKYITENMDGKSSFGSSLLTNVNYFGLCIGGEELIVQKGDYTISLSLQLHGGVQLNNKTSGTSYEYVPTKIEGPNNEEYSIFIRENSEYNRENLEEINSFYLGFELGAKLGYLISKKVSLQFITVYSVVITPFFVEMPFNLWRNSLQFRVGASYRLSSGS